MIIVQIAGNLGADPEIRHSPSGQKITILRIASTVKRQGKETTIWWRATVFGDHLDRIISYLKKGSAVIVFGKMMAEPYIYNDKNGQPQAQLEIIAQMIEFSPFGKSDRAGQEQGSGQQPYGEQKPQAARQQPSEPPFAPPTYGNSSSVYEGHSPYNPGVAAPFPGGSPQDYHQSLSEEDQIPF
jgi:single-strand DNA-binding protein